ncbi:MAG: hypothetical protein EOM23_03345 [Candidatus Moranbacteria bacterium]|nr:hypothetical protein [Candidatus Moranbacteria bacterium]
MSSVRQTIYVLLLFVIIGIIGLCITKIITDDSHTYVAPTEETFIIPDITPGETKIIDWDTADKLMSSCQIKVIFQKYNLEVTLRDRNGQIYQTTEPKINDIFNLAKKYQGPCDIVQTITE